MWIDLYRADSNVKDKETADQAPRSPATQVGGDQLPTFVF